MLAVIIIQVRSFSAMWMVMLTGPLGLIGSVPALLIFQQPFGFNRFPQHRSPFHSREPKGQSGTG
jgi:multidrug efflux pump subunit AcrB